LFIAGNHSNFAPRLGLAQQVHSLGVVLRAGFGTFYTPVDMNTWCNQRHNPPYVFAETLQSDNYTPGLSGFNFAPPVLGQTVVAFNALDPHSPAQYINEWNFTIQKSLPGHVILEVGYSGARGYHLQRSHLINNAPPGPGPVQPRRPYQASRFFRALLSPATIQRILPLLPMPPAYRRSIFWRIRLIAGTTPVGWMYGENLAAA
jgi:hypothetical protein